MTHNDYSLEDLLTDDSFLAYVFNTDGSSVIYWQKWLEKHPEKIGLIEEATHLARTLALKPHPIPESFINDELARLEKSLAHGKVLSINPPSTKNRKTWRKNGLSIAASLLLLVAATLVIWLYAKPSAEIIRVTTQSHSPAMLLLPDSSLVFLSSNSTIRYNKEWHPNTVRKVWLEGEAFFHVQPKKVAGGVKFQVYAGSAVVEVVGTRFNVLNRNNQTNVVLTAGKINFKINTDPQEKQIALLPGDMISVNKESLSPQIRRINIRQFPVLKEEKILFENTSVRKIAFLLQEQFGLSVHLQDRAIADLKVSGSFPLNNEKVFLETLAVVLDLQMEKRNNQEVFFRFK